MSGTDAGEANVLAYLQHQALERRADYVAQGRRFQAMVLDGLEAAWAEAFVAMCLHGEQSRIRDLDDLTAEIGLRGRALPAHLVKDVMPDILARARQWLTTGILSRFSERVGSFLRQEPGTTRRS